MRAYIGDMRQRLGLKADDTKLDEEIEKMSPEARLALLCGWHFGDPGWASTFIEWAKDAGFKVSPSGSRR
jgi:hypothetical protein